MHACSVPCEGGRRISFRFSLQRAARAQKQTPEPPSGLSCPSGPSDPSFTLLARLRPWSLRWDGQRRPQKLPGRPAPFPGGGETCRKSPISAPLLLPSPLYILREREKKRSNSYRTGRQAGRRALVQRVASWTSGRRPSPPQSTPPRVSLSRSPRLLPGSCLSTAINGPF